MIYLHNPQGDENDVKRIISMEQTFSANGLIIITYEGKIQIAFISTIENKISRQFVNQSDIMLETFR